MLGNLFKNYAEANRKIASVFNPKAGRSLSAGEVALAREIFGDTIDYASVRVVKTAENEFFKASAVRGRIFVPSNWDKNNDLSADGDDCHVDTVKKSVYLHEMTHVWQVTSRRDPFGFLKGAAVKVMQDVLRMNVYKYDIGEHARLTAFGIEQQAQIVEDYAYAKIICERFNGPGQGKVGDRPLAEVIAQNGKVIKTALPLKS